MNVRRASEHSFYRPAAVLLRGRGWVQLITRSLIIRLSARQKFFMGPCFKVDVVMVVVVVVVVVVG